MVSAKSVVENLDPEKYEVLPIKITKDNRWQSFPLLNAPHEEKQLTEKTGKDNTFLATAQNTIEESTYDVIFPVIHGPYGEDGTIQGMFEMMRVPYVGCGVLASALCMDKVIQKQLCQTHGIPVPNFTWFSKKEWMDNQNKVLEVVEKKLEYPCFVKPANQGSSVGISKAKNRPELIEAVEHAIQYDIKIILEQSIPEVREIECSVLGNENPQASTLGEIVPSNEFYDYDAKYVDGKSEAIIPAPLDNELADRIKQTAIDAFELLNCSGLARVDFLLSRQTGKYYLNELNTMPGFTSISMYPKLWQASGLSYSKLLDKLIELALQKYEEKQSISSSYRPKKDWYK